MKTQNCHYCNRPTNDYYKSFEPGKVRSPKTGIFPMIEVVMCNDCAFKADTASTCNYISEIEPLAG